MVSDGHQPPDERPEGSRTSGISKFPSTPCGRPTAAWRRRPSALAEPKAEKTAPAQFGECARGFVGPFADLSVV